MDHRLKDLLNLPRLQGLLDSLHELDGVPISLLDPDGNLLAGAPTGEACRAPGFAGAAAPIVIEGRSYGTLWAGSLLQEVPEGEACDGGACPVAEGRGPGGTLHEIPLIPQDRVPKVRAFLDRLAGSLAEEGAQALRQLAAAAYRGMGQEILRVLNEKTDLRQAFQRVLGVVKGATGVDAVGIRLQDQDDFPYFCQEGFTPEFLQKETSLLARDREGGVCRDEAGNLCLECTCGLVICGKTDPTISLFTSGGSAWTNDSFPFLHVAAEEELRLNPRNECIHQGYASVALIPIRAKGQNVGLLQLNDRRGGRFTLEAIHTLEEVAENIGEALLRKQAEEKLVGSERFLRALTDNLPGMIGYWNRDLRCGFANKAYKEWFGKAPEGLIGTRIQDLLGPELFAVNEPHMRAALRGEPQHFERDLVKPDGERCCTWAHYIPDLVQGEAVGFFVLVSDVTQVKRAEEEKAKLEGQLMQARKMESVGRLAGGVAHDFNNMLGVILGHAELALLTVEPGDPLAGSIGEIGRAAQRSADLIRQLLAFARKQPVSPRVLDLNEAVEGMLSMLKRLIGENIRLVWRPAADLWRVRIDPSQIDQIMVNLCVNAHDAIGEAGEIVIQTANLSLGPESVPVRSGLAPGEYVELTVCDDGSGMDQETLERIFEPFFTTKGVGEGTGLGLATTYGIVQQNHGYIEVKSSPGRGTLFAIFLPGCQEPPEPAGEEPAADPLQPGGETVLVVEDEPAILQIVSLMLTDLDYTVLGAASPTEALVLVRSHPGRIDLLITDVIMPELNGPELAQQLQALHPELKILFISGYTAEIITSHGVLEEGVHFLQKPFGREPLSRKLREILDR